MTLAVSVTVARRRFVRAPPAGLSPGATAGDHGGIGSTSTPASPTELLPRGRRRDADPTLDLDGRRAMFDVLARLTGKKAAVTLGRYELGRRLGQGGCGAVFVAHDPKLDREVAVKVLLPSAIAPAEASERLVREAQALAKLGHPNIIEVFDVGTDTIELGKEGRPRDGVYIVMEYIDGPTLQDWQVEDERVVSEILDVYEKAAIGLGAAHDVGVVHRDFKPANVMLTRDGRVKVLDFGLAREDLALASERAPDETLSADPESTGGGDRSLTRTGVVMGTPRYMAPEQHAAEPATPAADQYALCVALWEALTRSPTFSAQTLEGLAQAKSAGPPPRPTAMRGVSRAVYAVIARGLAPDPTQRFPSMDAFVAALRQARRPTRRGVWAGALVVGAAAAGLAAWSMSSAAPASGPPPWCDEATPAWTSAAIEPDPQWPTGASPRVDRFASRWTSARAAVCAPGRTEDPALVRAQADCLARAAAYFETARGELASDDDGTKMSARRRLWGAPSPQRCAEEDPASFFARTADEEAELDAIMARMRTEYAQPRPPEDTVEFIETSMARADALHDHATATELLTLLARNTHMAGDYDKAAQMDIDAALRCEAADDVLMGVEHLIGAIGSLSQSGAPPPEVDKLVTRAEQMLAAAGDPVRPAVELAAVKAHVLSGRGQFDEALALAYGALRRAETAPESDRSILLVRALDTASTAHINRGESYLALPLLERALELSGEARSDDKEKLALMYRGVAFAAFQVGQSSRAVEACERGLGIMRGIYAADHPGLVWDEAFHGFLLTEVGRVDEGLAEMDRARRTMLAMPRAPGLASVLANMATARIGAERYEEAERDGLDAIEAFSEQFGPKSPPVASVWQTVADARLGRDDLEGARQALDASREAMGGIAGPDPGTALVAARLALAEKRWDDARDHALVVLEHVGPAQLDVSSVGGRGEAFAVLAQVYAARGDLENAATMASFADPLLARGGLVHRRHRDELLQRGEPTSN